METSEEITEVVNIYNCCDVCGEDHPTELCPELGEIPVDAGLGRYATRARLTLPSSLEVSDNRIGTVGVIAREIIPARTQLGPFEAKRTTHVFDDTGFFTLKLVAIDGNTVCLDTTDENECNWLSLVRPAVNEESQNCMAYQLGTNIYYNTTRNIYPGEELQVWYTASYARKLSKPVKPDGISRALLGHRIEPLPTDLIVEPLADSVTQNLLHLQKTQKTSPHTVEQEKRGELKKAFYCPRCGSCFASQTSMVHHLREHVISGTKTVLAKTRKRGRPRIHPISGTIEPTNKRPRGRPRKNRQLDDEYMGTDLSEDVSEPDISPVNDTTDVQNTATNEDYDKVIDGDKGDDDNLNAADDKASKGVKTEEEIDDKKDIDYSPASHPSSSSRRVQPRRSMKGTNRHLMKDYIVSKVKIEPPDVSNVDEQTNEQDATDPVLPSNIGNGKKKRGRPKKGNQVNETAGNQKELHDLNATLAENGDKNGDENKPDHATNLDSTDAGQKDDPEVKTEDEVSGNAGKTGKGNLEVQTAEKTDGYTDTDNTSNKGDKKSTDNVENIYDTTGTTTNNADENKTNEVNTMDNDKIVITTAVEGPNLNNVTDSNNAVENNGLNNEGDAARSESDNEMRTLEKSREASFDNKEVSFSNEKSEIGTSMLQIEQMIKLDEENGMYTCTVCFVKFEDQLDANKHALSHDPILQSDIFNETESKSQSSVSKPATNNKPSKGPRKGKKADKPKVDESNDGPFACDICHQEFKTAQYLYRHMVMHTDMFSCRVCQKTFSRKDSLQKHVLKCCPGEAEKMKILHCDLCLRVFSTASGRKKHMEQCTLVQCSTCGCRFNSKEDLDEHKCREGRAEESGLGRYSCGKCPKSFQSLHYLKQHSLIHKKLHACSHCGKSLPSQEELESHLLTCQTMGAIKLLGQGRCERCGEMFNSVKAFREHALSHTHPYQCGHCLRRFVKIGTLSSHDCSNNPESFSCQTCSKLFKNQQSLDKHVKSHGCMRYQCSACEKRFRMKSEARDHKCEAENQEGRTILYTSDSKDVCAVCGKSFSTRSNLLKHMTLHGEKNFPCPHCDKRFHLDVYLKEHITSVHYKIYKYQCQDCGKLLKSKTGFNMHVSLFHSPVVERFPCTECPKIFKSKGNLKAHMYRHSSDRKFKCYICDRAFKFPDQLSRHKVEHKIVEKLACVYCEKQFCRRYELKRHLQIYHSGYVYVCGICSAKCGHRHTLVRHYKRKHQEDYHLLSQEGYLNSLMKHVSELAAVKQEPVAGPVRRVPTLLKHNKPNKLLSESAVKLPESAVKLPGSAVKTLQSMSVDTCTLKRYQLYRDDGVIKLDETPAQRVSVASDGSVILAQDGNILQPQTLLAQEQLLAPADGTISEPSVNEQIGLIQTSDGTININNIHGLPQTLETLDGSEGQIVILQIVESSDTINTDITQGEIIQQIKVETNDRVDIQQGDLQEMNGIQQLQTGVSDQVQIVNYPEGLNIVDISAVKEVDGGLLQIENVTNEQNEEAVEDEADDVLQVVQEGVSENDVEYCDV